MFPLTVELSLFRKLRWGIQAIVENYSNNLQYNNGKPTLYSSRQHIFRNILSFAHCQVKEFAYHCYCAQVSLDLSYIITCRLCSEMITSLLKWVDKFIQAQIVGLFHSVNIKRLCKTSKKWSYPKTGDLWFIG